MVILSPTVAQGASVGDLNVSIFHGSSCVVNGYSPCVVQAQKLEPAASATTSSVYRPAAAGIRRRRRAGSCPPIGGRRAAFVSAEWQWGARSEEFGTGALAFISGDAWPSRETRPRPFVSEAHSRPIQTLKESDYGN